jgi:uncharacterized protein (TIGR00296 family)
MLTLEDGKKAVAYARSVIEQFVRSHTISSSKLSSRFTEQQGAFVTIHTYPAHDLRGCIGIPLPVMSLQDSITEGARSATRDPRFPPLQESELDHIIIEVTILTKPEEITVDKPLGYLKEIEIGRDGLIVEQGFFNEEEFLSHTCMKAGLPPDAWFDKTTKILKFSGQVFTELQPRGEIKEKKLNGSDS